MVLKKSQEYGFNGYCVPVIPRGPRSVRKTGSHKKAMEDSRIYAFELLAAVAGKLLRESENSTSSNVGEGQDPSAIHRDVIKQEQLDKGETLRSECLDQGSWVESVSELAPQKCNISTKIYHDLKLEIPENKTAVENSPDKVEGGSLNCGEIERHIKDEGNHHNNVDLTVSNYSNSKDPMEINVNITHPLINSDSSVQLPPYKDSVPNASFPRHRNKLKFNRVDENSGGCNGNSSNLRAFRSQTRIGHHRMRTLLTSKYWKVAPKLEDCEFSNTDGKVKPVSCSRKAPYTSKIIQCQGPLKKRKLCDCSSTLACDPEGSRESTSNSPEKGMKGEKTSSAKNLHRAKVVSSSVVGHQTSFQSRDSYVKFSIKSFKVPELYIDVPENTTVGCLKKTVMEAVTAILQGELHVGVVVHGKKVKDDNKTLLQTGISPNDNLDTLGFMLENGSTIASPSRTPRERPTLLPCETHRQLTRSPASPILDLEVLNASFDPSPVTNVDNHVETTHELAPSPPEVLIEGTSPDSRALIAIPAVSGEAFAVVPVNQKTRHSELIQRRTRRPFSVSEVEALVEAVEKLGTGRWRDVKLSFFENADHRTYVDLKDKWKTLVHTATISPQQRRGEPVPQDLLDRVLSAHGYWSHHQQPKLHRKQLIEPLMISHARAGRV